MAKELFAAKLTSIWIGSFFFWMLKGFKNKLTDQFILRFEQRNMWTGYIIQLIFVAIILYFVIYG